MSELATKIYEFFVFEKVREPTRYEVVHRSLPEINGRFYCQESVRRMCQRMAEKGILERDGKGYFWIN
jgi:hypothetical protein